MVATVISQTRLRDTNTPEAKAYAYFQDVIKQINNIPEIHKSELTSAIKSVVLAFSALCENRQGAASTLLIGAFGAANKLPSNQQSEFTNQFSVLKNELPDAQKATMEGILRERNLQITPNQQREISLNTTYKS